MTDLTFTRRALDGELSPPRPGKGPHDWEFLIDGRAAGRCYMAPRSGMQWIWHWTLYDTNAHGDTDTINQAQDDFKRAFAQNREYLTRIWSRRDAS